MTTKDAHATCCMLLCDTACMQHIRHQLDHRECSHREFLHPEVRFHVTYIKLQNLQYKRCARNAQVQKRNCTEAEAAFAFLGIRTIGIGNVAYSRSRGQKRPGMDPNFDNVFLGVAQIACAPAWLHSWRACVLHCNDCITILLKQPSLGEVYRCATQQTRPVARS
jgi:hypothetical protein